MRRRRNIRYRTMKLCGECETAIETGNADSLVKIQKELNDIISEIETIFEEAVKLGETEKMSDFENWCCELQLKIESYKKREVKKIPEKSVKDSENKGEKGKLLTPSDFGMSDILRGNRKLGQAKSLDLELEKLRLNELTKLKEENNERKQKNVVKEGEREWMEDMNERKVREWNEETIKTELPRNFNKIKPIEIKPFGGEKSQYESFIASFRAIVDQNNYDAQYKMLQLRQYLQNDALKAIENLGYCEMSYKLALERLEKKFGGERRKKVLLMQKVEN